MIIVKDKLTVFTCAAPMGCLIFSKTNPTMKRYWSTLTVTQKERMTKQELIDADKFDAKLDDADVIAMQTIDADCNDCRHFKRGPMTKVASLTRFDGHCLKHNAPSKAWPTQYSGHSCFEHRRA